MTYPSLTSFSRVVKVLVHEQPKKENPFENICDKPQL